MKEQLWIGLVQLKSREKGNDVIGDAAGAFTNVVTWASDASTFEEKVNELAQDHGLYVVEVENPEPVSIRLERSTVADEVSEIIAWVELNPDQSCWGTLQLYPHEDA